MKALAWGLVVLTALPAMGREYQTDAPPPDRYANLSWVFEEREYPGYWYSAAQVQRIELRIRTLEDTAATDCFNRTQEANKELLLGKPLVLGTVAVVVGVALGIFIGSRL